jgi:HAD superfamily phosphoserine phosphatase-like hydrolase
VELGKRQVEPELLSNRPGVVPCWTGMQIYCDFDGTITDRDSIVFLTDRFGGGRQYRAAMLESIKRGELDVFDAIREELASVRISWEEAVERLRENLKIDPEFEEFVDWCNHGQIPLTVVSSGMDPVVELFIGHLGLPWFAHPVEITEEGWIYRKNPEHDKRRILQSSEANGPLVYIGDGTSDVSVVGLVDLLFAKNGRFLAEFCEREGISFIRYDGFGQIRECLDQEMRASRGSRSP